MRFIAGFLIALVLVVLAQLVIVSSGAYDIAATREDYNLEQWLLSTTMKRSVARRADEITAPQAFTEEQVQRGFRGFKEMCEPCHGAPGKNDSEVRIGLNPRPPDLAESARRWNRAQLFWIIKYGVRMTGMPAFGPTHEEQELWDLVSFIEQFPANQCRALSSLGRRPRPGIGTARTLRASAKLSAELACCRARTC